VTAGGDALTIAATGITFPDSTVQTTAGIPADGDVTLGNSTLHFTDGTISTTISYQDGIYVSSGADIISINGHSITFPDSTVQTTAAPAAVTNNSQLATTVNAFNAAHYLGGADVNAIVLCNPSCNNVYLTDTLVYGWSVGQQVLIINNSGFPVTIGADGSASFISYNGGYIIGANGCCAAVYIDANLWVISGNLTT
jgi:hypothetical protein